MEVKKFGWVSMVTLVVIMNKKAYGHQQAFSTKMAKPSRIKRLPDLIMFSVC